RSSKLMRDKWDRADYRDNTIGKATAGCRNVWPGPQIKEAPRPLFREIVPGAPFPIEALGKYGATAATDLQRATRAHPAICGQSVLATMNLAIMGHVDVEPPYRDHKPTSEYFATIAESGARKTSADQRATAGIIEYQNEHDDDYRQEYFEYKN